MVLVFSMKNNIDYKCLFENMPDLYLLLDPSLKILDATNAYLHATMAKKEEAVGKSIFEVFPDNPNDATATGISNLNASLERVLKGKCADTMAVQKYDVQRPKSEGGEFEERFWSPINTPVLGDNHEVQYIIHRVEDVTEFMMLQKEGVLDIYARAQEIQEANNSLRRINDDLDSFSYSISHDLRAPLRSIDGFSQILLEEYKEKLPQTAQDLLGRICVNVQHMGELIDDLLRFSHINRIPMNFELVNMNEIIKEVWKSLTLDSNENQVEISISDLSPCYADAALLKQVLFNLLSNAIKYSRKKTSPKIVVGHLQEGEKYIYYIKDNGVGFDMKYANKLFIPFQRLHTATEYEGTGVGLAIVRKIIDRHNGKIWFNSVLGEGSTFYFTLPLQPLTTK